MKLFAVTAQLLILAGSSAQANPASAFVTVNPAPLQCESTAACPIFAAQQGSAAAGGAASSVKKAGGLKGTVAVGADPGVLPLSEGECTRLGGDITVDGNVKCASGKRCKTVSPNGDIHSVCIDVAN